MAAFKQVYFEISGVCNARCPFCATGTGKLSQGSFISVDLFKKAIDRLIAVKLIDRHSCIFLYNWGEPFLHKQFDEILDYVNYKNTNFALSSNASIFKKFSVAAIKNLQEISFSMSGFSQASYNKIHGFEFAKIKANIKNFAENLQCLNFQNKFRIFFHIYQFNLEEIISAQAFAAEIGAEFFPYYAFIADYNKAKNYVLNRLSSEEMRPIAESIMLADMAEKIKHAPPGYKCPQDEILVLDEKAEILTCCFLPKDHMDYYCGNLFADELWENLENKLLKKECEFCRASGLSYCVHNITTPGFSSWLKYEQHEK